MGDDSRPRQVDLVAYEDHRLLVGIVLPPKVVQDVFRLLEGAAIRDREHDNARVGLVCRQRVLNLQSKQLSHSGGEKPHR